VTVRPGFYDIARGENHKGQKVEGGKVVERKSQWPSTVVLCTLMICITLVLIFG
jgi:hypothetical protein